MTTQYFIVISLNSQLLFLHCSFQSLLYLLLFFFVYFQDIILTTKTRQRQCETLLEKLTLHDKWWIHFTEALEKCGKESLASLFKDELKRIESENQKLSKGKRHTPSHNRHRSRRSLTDADSASPSASSTALRCPRRQRDSDDLSSGSSADNNPTGLPVRAYQPRQTGASTCGRNLEQNGPVPSGQILKRKDDICLECDSSDNSQRTYTLDTPLRQAPAKLAMSVYRHLDSKTRTGNYEELAGELGFNLEDLTTFVNTESVIQLFSQKYPEKSTFRVLMEALHKMGRKDVLEDIKQHIGLVCQVKEQDNELHDTSTRTLNRTCERMLGKVADRCDDVPDDPGVIPSDVTHAGYHDGFGIPSNVSQMKFNAPTANPSEAITNPAKKTVHDKTSENRVIEDDLATAVRLEEGVMALYGQKTEEYNGEDDKRIATNGMSEIPGNIDDGAKPPPIPKVLPGDSGTGARPKLYSANHDQREIYLPPDDINGRPTRKQLSHGRSNGTRSPSLGETVSYLRAPNREDTEHGDQALVPTRGRQLSRQCTNIPNFDDILPTNVEIKEKGDCRENGTSEPKFADCYSWSQYSENASVHDRLAQEVLEKEHLRGGDRLEFNGSDGTRAAAPDDTAIDHHSNHTRGDNGPIQEKFDLGKTRMNLGPCLSIDDSESESSSAGHGDEGMVTGNGSVGNSGLVNQQLSAGEERKKPPFLPNWKTLFLKLSLQLHDCMYTNTLPNWQT
ncbi:uncharacterized protein LOC124279509 [Haliotis rubra]|uniref:uncharacterized protein LOC124279509 n=1 Tax=Haliotis rubra TaxID=36100 RepID=UPI001EE561C0|nr:uncharacterized protein LOC124279509 [Haliotis rubra]